MSSDNQVFEKVKGVVVEVLGIEGRANTLTAETSLLEGIPEFDSMAVLQVMLALEENFEIKIDDEDITAEVMDTLGSLSRFVAARLG